MALPIQAYITDAAGNPVNGAKIYTYAGGTLTPKAVYTDAALSVAHANPIIADAGRATLFLGAGAYRIRVTDADGAELPAYAVDNVSGDVAFTRTLTGAVRRTIDEYVNAEVPQVVRDLGILATGADQTAALISKLSPLPAGVYTIPHGVKYNVKTLLGSMAANKVLLDLSGVNDFSAAAETTKSIGIISSDVAENDTHWSIISGHHAILNINNFGTAATTSASERKGSILFSAGRFEKGSADKRGFRGWLMLQATKDTGNTFHVLTLRQLAPWPAIAGDYELWSSGEVISGAGVYRSTGNNHYVSAGSGTCGGSMPTHTAGSVSDGGVSWTYIDSADRTIFAVDEFGRWGTNGSGPQTWRHKVGARDPSGTYAFEGIATGASKTAQLRLTPTDGAGAEQQQPFFRAESGVGLRVMKSDASSGVAAFTNNGALFGAVASQSSSVTSGATPSVAGRGCLVLNYASPTNITGLSDGVDDQVVDVVCQSANITFVHSSGFMLAGSANLATPAAWSVVSFRKIPVGLSDRWVETSRSLR